MEDLVFFFVIFFSFRWHEHNNTEPKNWRKRRARRKNRKKKLSEFINYYDSFFGSYRVLCVSVCMLVWVRPWMMWIRNCAGWNSGNNTERNNKKMKSFLRLIVFFNNFTNYYHKCNFHSLCRRICAKCCAHTGKKRSFSWKCSN